MENLKLVRRFEQRTKRALLRSKLWDEYQAYKKEFYTKWLVQRANVQQLQRQSEKDRHQKLLFAKREQRRMILSHGWQGKGIILQALMSVHALDCARKKSILYKQIQQERAEIKRRSQYLVKPFRSWRDFCETRAAEGDIAAQRALWGFRYWDRRKKASDCQILPEDESVFVSGVSDRFSEIWDFMLFIHEDGQVDYFDRKTQILSFSNQDKKRIVFKKKTWQFAEFLTNEKLKLRLLPDSKVVEASRDFVSNCKRFSDGVSGFADWSIGKGPKGYDIIYQDWMKEK